MKLPLFQVDAFTDAVFGGNPAAVCPLEAWLPDGVMQAIAAENNLSETAFIVPRGDDYDLRWFTPAVEVPLCGHATLASAFVVCRHLHPGRDAVTFHTQSGPLHLRAEEGGFTMTLPRWSPEPVATPALARVLGAAPEAVLATARDYVVVFPSESSLRGLVPDFPGLAALDRDGILATAPGEGDDFVLRYFAPKVGVNEDPVTGSAQCSAAPYWARRLDKDALVSRQISARGGLLRSRVLDDAVAVTGACALYLEGTISVPD